MATKLAHTSLNGLVDGGKLLVALLFRFLGGVRLLLEETASSYPDLVTGRDGFTGLVEDSLGFVRSLEACECKPELDRLWNDLNSARQQDAGILRGRFEVDGFLP